MAVVKTVVASSKAELQAINDWIHDARFDTGAFTFDRDALEGPCFVRAREGSTP
jgi:hypothetical protein